MLFRDFLRAEPEITASWALFERGWQALQPTRSTYGQTRDTATDVLMAAAGRLAAGTNWTVSASPQFEFEAETQTEVPVISAYAAMGDNCAASLEVLAELRQQSVSSDLQIDDSKPAYCAISTNRV